MTAVKYPGNELVVPEVKHWLVNKQNVVYKYQCDLCDANYIGYTSCHLNQRITNTEIRQLGIT